VIGFIPNRPIGSSARARFYQWVWDRLARGQHEVFAGPGIRVTRTARGMMVEALSSGSSEAGSRVKQYLLTDASAGDYFICRTLGVSIDTSDPEDPTIENAIGASDVYIAKPFNLRQSPFDRAVLNADNPGNIGTGDEITYDIVVESWDGATFSSDAKFLSFEYKSATFRIATDQTDPDDSNWTTQNQTIIPRFVPAILDEPEDGPVTTETISPTIIYAMSCSGLGITRPTDPEDPESGTTDITLLALNDGWAWAKT
jgi:hypothetical protein